MSIPKSDFTKLNAHLKIIDFYGFRDIIMLCPQCVNHNAKKYEEES